MSRTGSTAYQAPALDKGLDILEFLAQAAVPQSQAQIAEGLGRGPQEIFRMLTRLHARGYLLRDESSGRYELSLKLFQLGRTHSPAEGLVRVARPVMRDLAEKIGQSCHLCVLEGGELLVICHARSPLPVSLSVAEGSSFDPLATTSGKLLLGVLPPGEQRLMLARNRTWRNLTPPRRKILRTCFDQAKMRHRLILESEMTPGVTDVAVLVGSPAGPVCASLSVSCIGYTGHAIRRDRRLLAVALAAGRKITDSIGTAVEPRVRYVLSRECGNASPSLK
ncbi:MAG TPA: IclR family transcriptional regulator [Bryobacteraceae bacterium]|nr:IclR family transcriptional regulator [Bryobacteraceae bacterium]